MRCCDDVVCVQDASSAKMTKKGDFYVKYENFNNSDLQVLFDRVRNEKIPPLLLFPLFICIEI